MVTKIYIVRHTQTVGNVEKRLTGRKDYEVTEEGKKYIELLTERLKNTKFDKIYSSISGRAIKTVEPIAKLNHLSIETSEDLCEMNFGKYDGMKWEEVNKINPKIHEDHVKTNEIKGIEGQETSKEVAIRMDHYIRSKAKENEGKTILISSHGVAIEAFLRNITGESFTEKREEYSQKNTSLNIVEYDTEKDKFQLVLRNDIEHLKNNGNSIK